MHDEPSTANGEQVNEDEHIVLAETSLGEPFTIAYDMLMVDPGLTPLAKVAYQLLMLHARGGRGAWPGMDRLCGMAAVTENTMRKALNELRARGLLRSKRRGLGRTNLYTVYAPWAPADESPGSSSRSSDSADQEPRALRKKKVDAVEVEGSLFPTVTENAQTERRDSDAKSYRALYGAFVSGFGRQPQGAVERARWGKACKGLVGEATVEQVEQACAEWMRRNPDLPHSPQAVAGQMSDLLRPRTATRGPAAYDTRVPARSRAGVESRMFEQLGAAIEEQQALRERSITNGAARLGRLSGEDAARLAAGGDFDGDGGGVVVDVSAVEPRRLLAGD